MEPLSLPAISLPVSPEEEEAFHAPQDYLEHANQRKTVVIGALSLMVLALVAAVTVLAVRQRPAYVVVTTPDGQEWVVSTPKKHIDLRDAVIMRVIEQDLREFSEAYFEQSAITAQKDYLKARWFLTDQLLAGYDAAAMGEKGWVTGLQSHRLPESHVTINGIESRASDLLQEPYQTRVYLTRTTAEGRQHRSIATLTYIVRPDLADHLARLPLYNALGVFIVKPIEETPMGALGQP